MKLPASDVVIVGGGVIGMAIAHALTRRARRGPSVTVIDNKRPGNASWASAGGLWPIGESVGLGCGVIFFKTLSRRRKEQGDAKAPVSGTVVGTDRPHQLPPFFFDFCLKSNAMFPDLHRELLDLCGVDFKLQRTGLKFVLYDEDDRLYAQQIHDSIPHLAEQLRFVSRDALRAAEPRVSAEALGALEFLRDDQVNPYLLVLAYQEGARQKGARILPNTEVLGVRMEGGRVVAVHTTFGEVPCGLLINAAGAWAAEVARHVGLDLPVFPVRGQIVLSERLPPGFLRSCISTSDCYLAQKDNGEVLIGSTTEPGESDPEPTMAGLRELVAGAVRCVPALRGVHIKRTWAGLRPGTPDEIPILGPVPGIEGYLNACGHFRTGILTSAITGQVIAALVHGDNDDANDGDLTPFLLSRFQRQGRGSLQSGSSGE